MYSTTNDGSVLDESGRVLYFSVDRFIKDICEGDCCFICGAERASKEFNDEHVLPKWILKRFDLFKQHIGLPNDSDFRYDKYTIPCCKDCNDLMGLQIETPISTIVKAGHAAVVEHLKEEGPWLFFVWFNLLFIKTHLKDKSLRLHLDKRKPAGNIADHYTWEELHHIHCIARSFYTGAGLAPSVLGSMFALSMKTIECLEVFDYRDYYEAKTLLIRVGETAFVVVLKDSCAVWNIMSGFLGKITGPLSPIQVREVTARAASVYLHLSELPRFSSSFTNATGEYVIEAEHSENVAMDDIDPLVYGRLLDHSCGEIVDALGFENSESIRELLRAGKWGFLFDESGNFDERSMQPKEDEGVEPRE